MRPKIIAAFLVAAAGLGSTFVVADRAAYYHAELTWVEQVHPQEGLRLIHPQEIAQAAGPNLWACVGGSLFYYWFPPQDPQIRVVNWGGLEEKAETTWKRFPQTVGAVGARYVLINAGFCEIHTAVHTGRPVEPVYSSNIRYVKKMVEDAKTYGVVPVVSTLSPVRPRFLLPQTRWISIPSLKKKRENEAIAAYNGMLRKYCESAGVRLIDIHGALSDENGELGKEWAVLDGEHLSSRGYERLSRFLVEQMQAVMASSRSKDIGS